MVANCQFSPELINQVINGVLNGLQGGAGSPQGPYNPNAVDSTPEADTVDISGSPQGTNTGNNISELITTGLGLYFMFRNSNGQNGNGQDRLTTILGAVMVLKDNPIIKKGLNMVTNFVTSIFNQNSKPGNVAPEKVDPKKDDIEEIVPEEVVTEKIDIRKAEAEDIDPEEIITE